jgi:hypothetical protein
VATRRNAAYAAKPKSKPASRLGSAPARHRDYYANIHPGKEQPVPSEFVKLVHALEKSLGMPIWLIIHNGTGKWDHIGHRTAVGFMREKRSLKKGQQIAVLLDSPGGYARCAYQIANQLRKHCGGFTAVVPQFAKSAATLLALGADCILLGEDAELGPLDAQIIDPEREDALSALDEVQSVERLFASSLDAVDQTMQLLVNRTHKKVDTLLAPVLHFVSEMMRPLFEKIDTVHYTQYSRVLKVAEEYATRLLVPKYETDAAKTIARHLVERYPEHLFVIDSREASKIGLKTDTLSAEQMRIVEEMTPFLNSLTVSGRLIQKTNYEAETGNTL